MISGQEIKNRVEVAVKDLPVYNIRIMSELDKFCNEYKNCFITFYLVEHVTEQLMKERYEDMQFKNIGYLHRYLNSIYDVNDCKNEVLVSVDEPKAVWNKKDKVYRYDSSEYTQGELLGILRSEIVYTARLVGRTFEEFVGRQRLKELRMNDRYIFDKVKCGVVIMLNTMIPKSIVNYHIQEAINTIIEKAESMEYPIEVTKETFSDLFKLGASSIQFPKTER